MGTDEHELGTGEHELPTAANVKDGATEPGGLRAVASRLDTSPQLLAAARRLRRRLPGDEQFGDPLSTAGVRPVQVVARGVSGLQPERPSFLQEMGLAGLQVWQSLSEATGRGRGDQPLAILFTDLVGFSSWALQVGDAVTLQLLREVGTAVETVIVARKGRIAKRLGDGLMATFASTQDAVEAALEAQDALNDVEVAGYRPRMRAGVHWGRPRKLGSDFLGVDVNVAARVGEAAKAGEVLVSEPADRRLNHSGLKTSRPKRLRADGAPRDLHVIRVSRA
jgi:adenylate cyclase